MAATENRVAPDYDRWGAARVLIRTDFVIRYHGTVLGFLWSLAKPVGIFIVLATVFSFIFAGRRDYAINLIIGLMLYEFFSEGTKTGLTSLHAKGYLFAKSTFPRWILVVTSLANSLLNVLVMSVGVLVILSAMGRVSLAHVGLYLWYLLHLAVIVASFSLAASPLFLRYRDLNQVWEVVTLAGFFFAPVIYPIGAIPEKYHWYLYLWPPSSVIEFSRQVLISGQTPSLTGHLLLSGMAVVSLVLGVVLFRALEGRAAEYL
jgi:ABC-type polysaccharide/polyol phosphate export permease